MPQEFIGAMDLEVYKANWKRYLKNPGVGRYIVAVSESEVVGFSVFGPSRDKDLDGETTAELVAINVNPLNWRSGVGSSLLHAVLSELSLSYQSICLWVAEKNRRAINFYEYHGFALEGSQKSVPSHGNITEVRYITRCN